MRQSVCHPVLAFALCIEVAAFSLLQSVCSVWACFRFVSLEGCFSLKARTTCITDLSSLFCRRMREGPRVGASFEICRWDGSPKWPTLSALAWVYRFASFFISLNWSLMPCVSLAQAAVSLRWKEALSLTMLALQLCFTGLALVLLRPNKAFTDWQICACSFL